MESYKPIIIRPRSHEEWLKERESGIGASEVSAILGLNPWETPFSLWLKKTHQIPPTEENQAMKMGHLLEGVVATLWEEETGEKVIKASAEDIIYARPDAPYMRVTPDRIVKGRKKLVEIKSTSQRWDDIPEYYYIQVQYQMYVTGIHDADLAYLISGRDFGIFHVEYDEEFAEYVASEVTRFWNECVLGGKEPDPITAEDIVLKYPRSNPSTIKEADSEMLVTIAELRKKKNEYTKLEAEIEELTEKVKLYMGGNEAVTYEGVPLITWRSSKDRTVFDSKAFAAENPELYKKYTKTAPGNRTFLIKKEKEEQA